MSLLPIREMFVSWFREKKSDIWSNRMKNWPNKQNDCCVSRLELALGPGSEVLEDRWLISDDGRWAETNLLKHKTILCQWYLLRVHAIWKRGSKMVKNPPFFSLMVLLHYISPLGRRSPSSEWVLTKLWRSTTSLDLSIGFSQLGTYLAHISDRDDARNHQTPWTFFNFC